MYTRDQSLQARGYFLKQDGDLINHRSAKHCRWPFSPTHRARHTCSYGAHGAEGNGSTRITTVHAGVRDRAAGLWNPVVQLMAFLALSPIMIARIELV